MAFRPLDCSPRSPVLPLAWAFVIATGMVCGPAQPIAAEVLGDPLTHEYFLPESEEEADRGYAKYVMLLVLEGIGEETVKPESMPVLSRLVQEGAVTWSASGVQPAQQLPTMTSLLTGLPADKHGITWNTFDFIRGYPRPPTVFDYLDLSGGKDSAVFFMDEAMYQLARPEPYIDYQVCGLLKPECNPATVVGHIQEFFENVASGEGHGRAIAALPHLLVVHLPEARRIGAKAGWESKAYRQALGAVDQAIGAILDVYRNHKMLDRTAVFVTSLNLAGAAADGAN
ncbi:MAG: alkaline phosphatase family protein, partial [bacterium]